MARGLGMTKLIDIHDQAERLHVALEKFLAAHAIEFRKQHFRGDGFLRYQVKKADWPAANSVLPALRQLANEAPRREA